MWNRSRAAWALVLIPACFHPTYDRPACGPLDECPGNLKCTAGVCEPEGDSDGGTPGATPDGSTPAGAPPDAPPLCFGSYPNVCFSTGADVPTAALTLPPEIDTASSALCGTRNNQPTFCVVAARGLTIAAGTVRAYGARPLVLLSTTTVELAGTLDVSSTSAAVTHPTGPGVVDIASCADGAVTPERSSGGYGGSFGGKGGDGQKQDGGSPPVAGPAVSFPAALRAGCPGASGSPNDVGTSTGIGGKAGGAVAIIATAIHITGQINASGAAGTAGPAVKSGGGGGGSGGMIVLDSPSIIAEGNFALFANGGGGGQGGSLPPNGGSGQDGRESTGPAVPGAGGNNSTTPGGIGGSGAFGTGSKDGLSAQPIGLSGNAGGGAGGGGAGFIRAHGITTNIAPTSTDP